MNGFKDAARVSTIVEHSSDPDEVPPRFIRRSPLAPATKLCPRCLGPLSSGIKLGGWLVPQDYFCAKCGYAGTAFLEDAAESQPAGKE